MLADTLEIRTDTGIGYMVSTCYLGFVDNMNNTNHYKRWNTCPGREINSFFKHFMEKTPLQTGCGMTLKMIGRVDGVLGSFLDLKKICILRMKKV